MKSLIIIFAALTMIIGTPAYFTSVDDAITDDETNTFSSVLTTSGVTAANVTLGRATHNDDTQDVTSVTSNISTDSPSAYSYNSVSRALEISGLAENSTRTLSIEYRIDSTTLDAGAVAFWTLVRWFWIFIIVGLNAGAIYAFFD